MKIASLIYLSALIVFVAGLIAFLLFIFCVRDFTSFSERMVAEYSSADYRVMKCLRNGNATVGFYHVFYCSAMGMTNLLLVTRARNLEPKCKWLKKGTALIEPLNSSEIVFVEQEGPWFKCFATNGGNAVYVDFNAGK